MKRITVRLHDAEYQAIDGLARELGTTVSDALRSLISGHERTQKLLDAVSTSTRDILRAIAATRDAAEQARSDVLSTSNKHLENLKALADWLNTRLTGDKS